MFHDVPPHRLALLGAGLFAQSTLIPALLNLQDQFELVALYSRSQQTAQAAAQHIPHSVALYTELDSLLQRTDISAVGIALPINTQPEVIRAALRAGKHVLSEKPIAPTAAEARALLDFAAQYPDQIWMVAENYRFASALQKAPAAVAQLGKLAIFNWAIFAGMMPSNMYYHTAWRRDNSYQGGFLLDGGIHFMAALRMVLGEVAEVQAHTQSIRPDLPPVDTLTALLHMESGLRGTLAFSYAVGAPWSTALTVVGEQGVLEVNRNQFKLSLGDEVDTLEGDSGVEAEWRIFAECLQGAVHPLSDPRQALGDLLLLEAILESAQHGGKTITVAKA